MKIPKKPGRPKEWTPPPGHDNMMAGLKRAIAVPKEEIDRREQQWREQQDGKKNEPAS